MKIYKSIKDIRQLVAGWRREGQSIAFVPTMGNLHTGHLSLIEKAQHVADKTIVSIYVNPLQFGPVEDFASYPRTLDADKEELINAEVDLLFIPDDKEIYPFARPGLTSVKVPELSEILCGASRPGHFAGVTTVVAKFFNIVQPSVAIFGEKDFQQLFLIKKMVVDLNIPVRIISMPTSREDSGLALSSRNKYLTDPQKQTAAGLHKTLCWVVEKLQQSFDHTRLNIPELEQQGLLRLEQQGFKPEYLAIRDSETLTPVASYEYQPVVVLVAAMLGKTRLIDNISVT